MSGTRSLDDYIWRRMRIAGGTLLTHGSIEENVAALKQVYFQPLDALHASVKARAGRFVSFANYDYTGTWRGYPRAAGGGRCRFVVRRRC